MYLLLIVVFQCGLKAFLQSLKHKAHVIAPADLSASEGHLGREVQNPLLPGPVLINGHSLRQVTPDTLPHGALQTSQPYLNLIESRLVIR